MKQLCCREYTVDDESATERRGGGPVVLTGKLGEVDKTAGQGLDSSGVCSGERRSTYIGLMGK